MVRPHAQNPRPVPVEPGPSLNLGLDDVNVDQCREFIENISMFGEVVPVRVVSTAQGIDDWLQQSPPEDFEFGLDIEWRPKRRKGERTKPALLQLASKQGCLIIQLCYLDYMPDSLADLLADKNRQLAGVGSEADCVLLFTTYRLETNGKVELRDLAGCLMDMPDVQDVGLAKLYTRVFQTPFTKDKRITMSDWSVPLLSKTQIQYAASDAWASYALLRQFNTIRSLFFQ